MRKVCVITGSRAEYGILSGLMQQIKQDPDLELQIIATNMHLSSEFGLTYKEIEKDGFFINKKVEMLLSSDSANATVKSIGLATIGFADAYEDLKPDLNVVLGDRYEILAAVSAALIYKIPVAHLHGGEITEGAFDDAIRHSITKMSHLHFTSTETYRQRVIQLGENPEHVFNVGALGIENINRLSLLSKPDFENSIQFNIGDKFFLVTFHPVTLENNTSEQQFQNLLSALDCFPDYNIIFTLPNSDTGGRVIITMIHDYVEKNKERCIQFQSLGLLRYLSALKYCSGVIGNSSSAIIEAPSFGIPTLNIGDRQKGRVTASSVHHCEPTYNAIHQGIHEIISSEFTTIAKTCRNPYEKKDTSKSIISTIKNTDIDKLVTKHFYDL
jgi:UDP-N-acetylglucosamine 2-epimerase (non-hydrolysing)/GDP/UDP-N,N'-diacetylbacillosamine 2-epimerase (hydrolysing)